MRFYEETSDGIAWEDYGIFKQSDVHRQVTKMLTNKPQNYNLLLLIKSDITHDLKCAIVLKTPAYKTQEISSPVTVSMQLWKPSDNSCGEPMPFQYIPCIKGKFLIPDLSTDISGLQNYLTTYKLQLANLKTSH